MTKPEKYLTIAVTGASGAPYALNLLRHLDALKVPIDLIASESAMMVLKQEVDEHRQWAVDGRPSAEAFGLDPATTRCWRKNEFQAPIASGSAPSLGMVVVPCSMGTLGRLAAGVSANLLERAAAVCLKESRRLVVVPRESPLSQIDIRNMQTLQSAGATILPASPGFYFRPETIEDLLDHISARILNQFELNHQVSKRWGQES